MEILNTINQKNDKLNSADINKIAYLLSKFKALIKIIEFVRDCDLTKHTLTDTLHGFLDHQEFVTPTFNNREYGLPMCHDLNKQIAVHATKTSIGYLLHPEYREAYYCIARNQVAYFLVFNDRVD